MSVPTDPRVAPTTSQVPAQRSASPQLAPPYVRSAADVFEARRVALGPTDGERVSVIGRLQPGEEVVTEGSFLLKTETLKGSIGAGCCAAD